MFHRPSDCGVSAMLGNSTKNRRSAAAGIDELTEATNTAIQSLIMILPLEANK